MLQHPSKPVEVNGRFTLQKRLVSADYEKTVTAAEVRTKPKAASGILVGGESEAEGGESTI